MSPMMSLSFHQVIRDKRTGKTKGFLEEVDSQGDHPAENSFQTRNSCNNRSFMVEKKTWWMILMTIETIVGWIIDDFGYSIQSTEWL